MFYIKMYSFILQDKTLTNQEKIVLSFFVSRWDMDKEKTVWEINVKKSSEDLGIDRWNFYKVLDSLQEKGFIKRAKIGQKHLISLNTEKDYSLFKDYQETNKTIKELKEKWKKQNKD